MTNEKYQQLKERIIRWNNILKQVSLLETKKEFLSINDDDFESLASYLNCHGISLSLFESVFLESYSQLSTKTAGIIDFANFRKQISTILYQKHGKIVSENMIDKMIIEVKQTEGGYFISFGKAMGAGEQLFLYRNKYYRTIYIRNLR